MTTNALPTPTGNKSYSHVPSPTAHSWWIRLVWVLLIQWIAFGVLWGLNLATGLMDAGSLWLSFAVVQIALVGHGLAAEFPRGNDWTLARLYVATACRSGIPLFAALTISLLIEPNFFASGIGCLVGLYAIGLISTVWFSVRGPMA